MAGSFEHVHDPEQPQAFRFDLIENMGDAHEACEHMHLMILLLACGRQVELQRAIEQSDEVLRGERDLPEHFTNILPRED